MTAVTQPVTQTAGATEARFRAMGSDAHVLVTGPDGSTYIERARRRIDCLEQRWSRFLPDSEVANVNRQAGTGRPTPLGPETVALLKRARLAWTTTSGVWNPFQATTLKRLGYDQSFDSGLSGGVAPTGPAATFDDVDFDPHRGTLALPADVGLDLGGIGKGFAADLITAELVEAGAWGALVNLGGDLRTRGLPPNGLDWCIDIGEPAIAKSHLATIRFPGGGVATSTTARRRWQGTHPDHAQLHHLIDPQTSQPATSDVVLTTSISSEAWWAEVCATALTIDPSLDLANQSWLQVTATGHVTQSSDFSRFES